MSLRRSETLTCVSRAQRLRGEEETARCSWSRNGTLHSTGVTGPRMSHGTGATGPGMSHGTGSAGTRMSHGIGATGPGMSHGTEATGRGMSHGTAGPLAQECHMALGSLANECHMAQPLVQECYMTQGPLALECHMVLGPLGPECHIALGTLAQECHIWHCYQSKPIGSQLRCYLTVTYHNCVKHYVLSIMYYELIWQLNLSTIALVAVDLCHERLSTDIMCEQTRSSCTSGSCLRVKFPVH